MANQKSKSPAGYPRYLLFDQHGELVTYDAKKPSDGMAAIAQIESIMDVPLSKSD